MEDALEAFDAALAIDSGFPLAALGYAKANYMGAVNAVPERGQRLMRLAGDRLSPRDRAYAAAVFWDYTRPAPLHIGQGNHNTFPFEEQLALLERAVELAPDDLDALLAMGQAIWWRGQLIGMMDRRERAIGALNRAVALDSTWPLAIGELLNIELAWAPRRDTMQIRRLARMYFARDSTSAFAEGNRWRVALALQDTTALATLRTRSDSLPGLTLGMLSTFWAYDGASLEEIDRYNPTGGNAGRTGLADICPII